MVMIRDKAGRLKRANPRTAAGLVKMGLYSYETTAMAETPVLAPAKKVVKVVKKTKAEKEAAPKKRGRPKKQAEE